MQSVVLTSFTLCYITAITYWTHAWWSNRTGNNIIHYNNTLSSLYSRWPPLAILLLKTVSGLGDKAYLHKDNTELPKRHNGQCTGNERQPFHWLHSAQQGTPPQKTAAQYRHSPKTRESCFVGKTDKSFWKCQSQAVLVVHKLWCFMDSDTLITWRLFIIIKRSLFPFLFITEWMIIAMMYTLYIRTHFSSFAIKFK